MKTKTARATGDRRELEVTLTSEQRATLAERGRRLHFTTEALESAFRRHISSLVDDFTGRISEWMTDYGFVYPDLPTALSAARNHFADHPASWWIDLWVECGGPAELVSVEYAPRIPNARLGEIDWGRNQERSMVIRLKSIEQEGGASSRE